MTTTTPAVLGDSTDTARAVGAGELARARAKFMLDAAPLAAFVPEQPKDMKPEQRRRVARLVESMGTPLDVARALMRKQPPKEWETALREISPVSTAHSYLIFAWKEPLLEPDKGRWCVYEAIPDAAIETERRFLLSSTPYWERGTKGERQAQAQLVSAYQWEMYRLYRLDVRPFWCLQGDAGGTPLHLNSIEKRFLRMMGQSDTPHAVGALPFAPWDARAATAVLGRDRLLGLGRDVDRLKASGTTAAVESARQTMERAFRAKFWDWMAEKLAPNADALAHLFKNGYTSHMRRETKEESRAAADARDVFIETGTLPDPVQYRR